MFNRYSIIFFVFTFFSILSKSSLNYSCLRRYNKVDAKFVVIGSGPAGIASIGILIESGIDPNDIVWLDNEFGVGRIGKYYENVPGNTKTKLFIDFIESCKVFRNCKSKQIDELKLCDKNKEVILKYVSQALRAITQHLCKKVHAIRGSLKALYFDKDVWNIKTNYIDITSKNIILATGSKPKSLKYDESREISLDLALDKQKLASRVNKNDTVMVVGSSHSAVLILKYLTELNVKKIINIYKNDFRYAIDMGNWTLYSNSGLKGIAAKWAKEVLEKFPPKNLERIKSKKENVKKALSESTKIIYAIGYERNDLPELEENPNFNYDDSTGFIAPGLFGIGIAFPETYVDNYGNKEYKIGLNSFIEYAQRVVPYWIENSIKSKDLNNSNIIKSLHKFEKLFNINIL